VCSYCGCRAITVIGELTTEHDAIINATGQLCREAAAGDAAAARIAADAVSTLLAPHAIREEIGLFAELRRDPEFTDHVDTLCAEHRELDVLISRVSGGDLGAATALDTLMRRHIDREENGIFPAAAIALDGETWDLIDARAARLIEGAASS
jgi:hypothetical protein